MGCFNRAALILLNIAFTSLTTIFFDPLFARPLVEFARLRQASGFEVLEAYDANDGQHSPNQIPWYATLQGEYSLKGFRMTPLGRVFTHIMVSTLEFLRIAPKGSVRVSALLNATACDLVEGGEKQLFTPSYFFLARKK